MADAHLVMNVLNKLVAEDYAKRGTENPLLFALSDYLREEFLQTDWPCSHLVSEIKSFRAYIGLMAEVSGWDVEYTVNNVVADPDTSVTRGSLARIFNCLPKPLASHSDTRWLLEVNISDAPAFAGQLLVKMDLRDISHLGNPDLRHTKELLTNLAIPKAKAPALWLEGIQFVQESPAHLRLECRLRSVT